MIHLHRTARCAHCDWTADDEKADLLARKHMEENPHHATTTSGHPTTRCREIHGEAHV